MVSGIKFGVSKMNINNPNKKDKNENVYPKFLHFSIENLIIIFFSLINVRLD